MGIGRITHAASLADIPKTAGLMLDVELGGFAQVRYTLPTLRIQDGNVEFEGKFDLARLMAVLPPRWAVPPARGRA